MIHVVQHSRSKTSDWALEIFYLNFDQTLKVNGHASLASKALHANDIKKI